MFNPKLIPMKALKITLMIALFLSVSSQTEVKSTKNSVSTYEKTKTQYNLLAHCRERGAHPRQG